LFLFFSEVMTMGIFIKPYYKWAMMEDVGFINYTVIRKRN
jgi:hypothetical protein